MEKDIFQHKTIALFPRHLAGNGSGDDPVEFKFWGAGVGGQMKPCFQIGDADDMKFSIESAKELRDFLIYVLADV